MKLKNPKKSEILASHSIVKNIELIKLIAEDLAYNKDLQYLQEFLRESINETKQDKSNEAVTLAANSITLLVAAQYSFSGKDLSNISIKGANIRNGIFQYVDFSNADLTAVNLTNANLVGAKFISTNMTSVELSIHPDLKHDTPVNCISYSPDGRYIAAGTDDNIVRIWNAEYPKNAGLLKTLGEHTDAVWCISYSPDGKYLASGSKDNTVKIWNAENPKNASSLKTLEGNTNGVVCISYSPLDGKYLVSGSSDHTIKIWEKKSNPLSKSKEDVWYVIREISATESPLTAKDATIKKAIISTKNQKVFEQKGAKVLNNKEVNYNEVVIPKKNVTKEPNALLQEKLELAAKQKALKLVKVKSNFIKETIKVDISTQNNDISVNVLMGIKYDNPLLNNPMLLKKLASNLTLTMNKAIDASDYLTNLFGSKDFNYICNSDQSLLQELL